MSNKEKIEELAKDLRDCQEFSDIQGYQTDFYNTAVNLWSKGYRKLGKTVLKLDLGNRSQEEILKIAEALNKPREEEIATETARGILTFVGNIVDDGDDRFHLKDYQWFRNLCIRYGVEIK